MGDEDTYQHLEDDSGADAIHFVESANRLTMTALGSPPTTSPTYSKILDVLEEEEKIPLISQLGIDESGKRILLNFWKDDTDHPKGVWRRTTLESYEDEDNTEWTDLVDVDKLSKDEGISWIWKGARMLPRGQDPASTDNTMTTRALISLSREGTHTVEIREFDFLTSDFVKTNPFNLPEGRTRISYKSRDVLFVSSDLQDSTLTKAGNPTTIREWKRGTDFSKSKLVFQGESSDIAVGSYVDDQRHRKGDIFEVQMRRLGINASKYWVRKIKPEHTLSEDDPARKGVSDPPSFQELQVPDDAEINFVGNLLVVSLDSEWSPEKGKTFSEGAIVYVNAHKFIKYGPTDRIYHVMFQPTEGTKCDSYHAARNFIICSVQDTIKSRLEFYKLEKDGNKLRLVGMDKNPQIRVNHVQVVDSYASNEFWLTTYGYTEPSTVWLADASKMDSSDKKVIRKTGSEGYMVRKLKGLSEAFEASDLHVLQKIAKSKDGTDIPYFLIMKKGTQLDKNNPTLLHAYGGFGVSLGPNYSPATGIAWLDRGGVYVEANVRGGGEFGPTWHSAAVRGRRGKSLEDIVAVAEDLIASRICRPKTLGLRGGLNGGLLVANVYVSRPDLFGAAHCAFPILDLKRFKELDGPESWVEEFGDPDKKDWEKFIKDFSPYHNIDDSVKKRPPILFTTSCGDKRVHPGHARKMVNKLWDLSKGRKWPAYYYEEMQNDSDDAKEYAFVASLAYDFLYRTLHKNAQKERKKAVAK
ncbi:unnamed protein product [Cylindrotheca closterium]|uniref:Prolyl endopeptidase n=1 Tax=Cylindrotheca closterium TaxID=2856 RepID=A0AAD2G679_9STRA|nr:unnamed protein product [Cylindrotheca closterium]